MLDDVDRVFRFLFNEKEYVQSRIDALTRIMSDLRLYTLSLGAGPLVSLHDSRRLNDFFRIAGQNGLCRVLVKEVSKPWN